MNAAVFLDRDNTLIHNDGDLGDPAQVKLIMGAASAIASLKGLNLKIIVVSNQGGVARGKYGEADVVAVNDRINELIRANSGVAIDRFYFCPYHPEGIVERYRREHPWRKPRPGMLLQAAKDFQLDLKSCWMIGDQMRDVLAGYAAGAVPILIGDPGQPPAPMPAVPPGTPDERWLQNATATIRVEDDYFIARNLIEAVRYIGQQRRPTNVAAAMKAQREEVVPRSLPRVATAAFDPDSVVVVASEHPLVARAGGAPAAATATNEAESKASESAVRVKTRGREQAADEGSRPGPRPSRRTEAEPDFDEESSAAPAEDHPPSRPSPDESHADRPRPTRRPPGRTSPRTEPADEKPRSPRSKATAPSSPAADSDAPAPAPRSASTTSGAAPAPALEVNRTSAHPAAAPSAPGDISITSVPTDRAVAEGSAVTPIAPDAAASPGTGADATLRQILQELRNQRSLGGEFSFVMVVAIVVQMLAIVCLLAGLLMGGDSDSLFTRWAVCAVVLQLATIALLLFRR